MKLTESRLRKLIKEEIQKLNEEVKMSDVLMKVKSIVDNHQAQKINGVLVDAQTANGIMLVWNKVKDPMKVKLNKLKINQLANLYWSMVKK
jgi:hypothetical protein